MTGAAVSRPGSFWQSWRLFLSGHLRNAMVMVMGPGLIILLEVALVTRTFSFAATLGALGVYLVPSTLLLEIALADRLAFMALLPQPAAPRRLVLLPVCLYALLGSVGMVAAARGPALAAVAVFGCACWMIGSTRLLLRLRFWPLALPLVLVAPVTSVAVLRAGGWGAAAAAGMALGIVVLAVQPRVLLDPGSVQAADRGVERSAIQREAVSRPVSGRRTWLASAAWFLSLTSAHQRAAYVFSFTIAASAIAIFHFPGCALFLVALCAPPSQVVGAAFSPEATEFVGPRPFSLGQRLLGGLLVPLLITVGFSVLMLPCFSLAWINGGGLPGRLFAHVPFFARPNTDFLRGLGATFLPEKWPAGGLSAEDWARVRPLLGLDLLRANLFSIAALFSIATLPIATGNRKQVPSLGMLMFMTILLCSFRIQAGGLIRFAMPTWWFAGLLAIAAVVHWRHFVRRAHAHARAGGDVSTAVGLR